jgi:hypothetical protein
VDSAEPSPLPFGTFRPSERRALIGCAFASGCILLMPGELIGSMLCFVLAGILGLWHARRSKRERAETQAKAAAAGLAKAESERETAPPAAAALLDAADRETPA